jgi:hypothetical protein
MMLFYIACIAFWEAMFDPRLWTEETSSPARSVNGKRSHSASRPSRAARS